MQPIHFEQLSSSKAESAAAQYLADYLSTTVSSQPTMILLSGGSAIAMYVQFFKNLVLQKQRLENVIVSLVDERFGPVGHSDSNATQLEQAGVIQLIKDLGGEWRPYMSDTLTEAAAVAEVMSNYFDQWQKTHQILVLAGLGDDSHTAGLLPTDDEKTIHHVYQSQQSVVYYELPPDTDNPYRQRFTTTPCLLAQAHQVIVYALGAKKIPAFKRLVAGDEPLNRCPALALRAARSELIVLTDQQL